MHATEVGDTLLLHHFDDVEQQKTSSNLGMWTFLATEVMFFGGLFAAYSLYRWKFAHEFGEASRHLNVWAGGINTCVLLVSSLTMALAVHATQTREIAKVVRYLVLTMVFGSAFLGVKAYEWYVDYEERLIPGINFDWAYAQAHAGHEPGVPAHANEEPPGPPPRDNISPGRMMTDPRVVNDQAETPTTVPAGKAQMFFVIYFFMTGLHALHMVIGIVAVGIMAWLSHRRWFSGGGETQIESLGLYWHFVDIVWVFLYPLLYLIEVNS